MIVTSATWKLAVVRRVRSFEFFVQFPGFFEALSVSSFQMPRFGRRGSRQRAQRRHSPTTRLAAPRVSGLGLGRGRPATLPTQSTGVPDGTSASAGKGSRHSATLSQPPTVMLTEWHSNQLDEELPHDLEQLQSVIRIEIQQALATAVSQTANTSASTQLAPPASLA